MSNFFFFFANGGSCHNDVKNGVVDVNEGAWKAAVCSSAVWVTSGGGVCTKAKVPQTLCIISGVMLLKIGMDSRLFNEKLCGSGMVKGIGPSIFGLQGSLIGVLNVVGPLGCRRFASFAGAFSCHLRV